LLEVTNADLERFLDKVYVDDTTGCWIWTAYVAENGYGQFKYRGVAWYAHRWSYATFKGDVNGTHDVHHTCGMRCCVNPKHLVLEERSAHGSYHWQESEE